MIKAHDLHSRRSTLSSIPETYQNASQHKISKPDSRNINPSTHFYGRRSESVTGIFSNKQIITLKDSPHNTQIFTTSPYGININTEIAIFHNTRIGKVAPKKQSIAHLKPFKKEDVTSIEQLKNERLIEELKNKSTLILEMQDTIRSIETILNPIHYSIKTLQNLVSEYQTLQQTQASVNNEIQNLKQKYTDVLQQLKFEESIEKNNRHQMHKGKSKCKSKNANEQKTPFEKLENLLSNININLFQIYDTFGQQEFAESIISIKVEKEAEEIVKEKSQKNRVSNNYSERNISNSTSHVEIDESRLEYIKKCSDDQIGSLRNGYNEMKDCWKLYYSFMRSFLEIYEKSGNYNESIE